jgi:hypothetical protein
VNSRYYGHFQNATMSTIHADASGRKERLASPARGLGLPAVFVFPLVALVFRVFRRSAKAAPDPTFGGMNRDEFASFARQNPAPQHWFDEDARGLRRAAR